MKKNLKKYIKEIFIFLVLILIISNGVSYFRSQDLNKEKLDIETVKLMDNSIYEVKENKPLVVHFWATWCPTCEFEASNIEKISKDFQVITIAVQSGSKDEIKDYLEKNNLSFKVVNDIDGFYSRKFNIKAFPTTLIFDSNKNLKFSEVGYTSTLGLYARVLSID